MENEKVFAMSFAKVYTALVNKAIRKGRTQSEVDSIISWMTGYTEESQQVMATSELTYGDFFRQAPAMNPRRENIKGVVCGIRVENVEDPLMRDIRRLDKLVDELAKGKSLERILAR
ncbi:MAG: DUF2200 domain-containing protein [Clostridia bacterium]|nr:DUF2200 domain-containing protein [Clostridia bacterium]